MKNLQLIVLATASIVFLTGSGCEKNIPTAEITSPTDGATVTGFVDIVIEATDVEAVLRVDLFIDDSLLVCQDTIAPYVYTWNTTMLPDSSQHEIYAIAYDYDGHQGKSETITVTVTIGPLDFHDDFESYAFYEYPSARGWYELWSGNYAWVESGISHGGSMGFVINGFSSWVRADGIDLPLVARDVRRLVYEYAIMIPSGSAGGANTGFFMFISSSESRDVNFVTFSTSDFQIYATGIAGQGTGYTWAYDTWYAVKVELDYDSLLMDVWLEDTLLIASDLTAAPRDTTQIFALETQWGNDGTAYFDDIHIYEE
ncbi:MAG TPA: Ig-like domain-containing protein [bacterium]